MPFYPTHGMSNTRIYLVWRAMLDRCNNPSNKAYKNYGGRGIKVCDEWHDFEVFLRDVGAKPSAEHTLDRKDNNAGYSPSNCAWSTRKEQGRNKRANRTITASGQTKLLCEWSEETGLSHCTILRRISRGWSEEEAVLTPLVTRRKGIKRGLRIKDHQ